MFPFFIRTYYFPINVNIILFVLSLHEKIDLEKLKSAIQKIVEKHEILRTTLTKKNQQIIKIQKIDQLLNNSKIKKKMK